MNRIWGFLFLSFSLHVFSGTVATVVAPRSSPSQSPGPAVVELLETTPQKRSQEEREAGAFAGKIQVPESFKVKKEVKRNWGSEEELTVIEQTRAKDTGLNANRDENGGKLQGRDFSKGKAALQQGQRGVRSLARAELEKFEHGEVAVGDEDRSGDETKPLRLPSFGGEAFERGESSFAYSAPDIKVGKITALNTERFVYFGFYQRAEERVYPHWENFVRAAIYTYQNTHRVFGSKSFDARYEVLLRPDGTYEKAILRESSGVNGIDLALAQAFRRAKQIPHPPPEMVKDDGYIHLDYTINVDIGPSQVAEAE